MEMMGPSTFKRAIIVLVFATLLPFQAWGQNPPPVPAAPEAPKAQVAPQAPKAPSEAPAKIQATPAEPNAPNGRHPDLVRLTFGSGWDGLPAIVGIERGFFDQENIVISGLPTTSAEALANSLAAGSTDFAEIPQRFFIALAASNIPIKAVAVGVSGTQMELVVKAGSGVKSITDLKGKTIGIANSTESLGIFMRLLNAAKMTPADVKVTLLAAADIETAFDTAKADAIFESLYYTRPLVQSKKADVVMKPEDVVKSIGLVDAMPLVAPDTLIQKQPDLVQRVVRAWIKSLLYIQQDPKDAAAILQIYLHRQGAKVPLETAQAWIGIAAYNRYEWSQPLVADAEYNAWGLQQANVLKVKDALKLGGFVDNSFAQKAMQSLGIK
jgi:ABC-type nitrate/sulfonate/bicarbonate transport system substrate-binding protein